MMISKTKMFVGTVVLASAMLTTGCSKKASAPSATTEAGSGSGSAIAVGSGSGVGRTSEPTPVAVTVDLPAPTDFEAAAIQDITADNLAARVKAVEADLAE